MSKIMYLGSFKFKSKSTNKDSHGYRFVEFYESRNEKLAKENTLFSDADVDVSGLTPGDIVTCKFDEPARLGGKPTLIGISKVENSTMFLA